MHTTELKVSIVCFEKAARSKSKTELTCNSEASECDKEMADSTVFLCRKIQKFQPHTSKSCPRMDRKLALIKYISCDPHNMILCVVGSS